ncbi:hypothetical protein TRAPUB_7556 [Trametes pubescens]|uniref:Uncharacterized protein n=1 Tax=Trametes pubescens TaxID=154538 RepID=A0A1M2V358_TRAPU|nr:hypothetical protein TRAPUB_7556 [Trametes pubescens]
MDQDRQAEHNTDLPSILPPMPLQAAVLNAGLHIHRLPPELLMMILYDARRRPEDIRFAHVCHHWRTLLLAMPEFWASMFKHIQVRYYDVHHERTRYFLELSSPRFLKLEVLFAGEWFLAPHASRIVHLSIWLATETCVQRFDAVLKAGLPNLASLYYSAESLAYGTWQPLRPLSDCSLPALRQVHIPAISPLDRWVTPTVEHIILYRFSGDMRHLRNGLSRCRSLKSLTISPFNLNVSTQLMPHADLSPKVEMCGLRRLYLAGTAPSIIDILAQFNVPPSVHLQLRCDDVGSVIAAPTIIARHIFPALASLYLGRTHRSGGVRLLGYTHSHVAGKFNERLNVGIWRDWSVKDALAELLRPFAASGATALAIDLPRLPLMLEASGWGQPSGVDVDADSDSVFLLPRALSRMELLGDTPGAVKVRFARAFVRDIAKGASATLTLCWVLDVARERASEERAREELEMLRQLLAEFDAAGRRLGRLELYGTLQIWVVATRAGKVSTNVRRCAEVARSFLPHFEELVDTVVLV